MPQGVYDFKKAEREYYLPGRQPELIEVPPMRYAAISGQGDPNEAGGDYQRAVAALQAIAYTIRMAPSPSSGFEIPGHFAFVIPPLETLWDLGSEPGRVDPGKLGWTAMMRLPDFVTDDIFAQAVAIAAERKGIDPKKPFLLRYNEGKCVQCLHVGSYDDAPVTIQALQDFTAGSGLQIEYDLRRYHDIYLSDPKRTNVAIRRTVIRLPVRREGR